jgi:transcriptional regulator of acetoin/glycerol metabolism
MGKTASTNEAERRGAARCGLVTYVLCYEHLLADASRTLPLLGPDVPHIDIARSDAGPLGFEGSTFWTADPYVSSHHARFRCQGFADVVENLSTTKPVFVHGDELEQVKVGGSRGLRDGDLIEVGHSLFSYRSVLEPAARPLVDPATPLMLGLTPTRTPEAAALVETIRRLAPSELSLMLFGEPGTGKEHVARQIHGASIRAKGPFIAFNCGALQGSLAESGLFGHERGAFTGAVARNAGLIAGAEGGTLFLDEVGELALSTQPVLLRAIEAQEMRRVGSNVVHRLDVRWLAATNADISDERRFRPDLHARLAGYELRIPPLRERREDLGTLAAHLLRGARGRTHSIKKEAARTLFFHDFPGNIREFRNVLEAASLLASDGPIDVHHLGATLSASGGEEPAGMGTHPAQHGRQQDPGRAALEHALERAGNNKTRAAQLLNAHPRSFARWLEKHGLG